MRDGDFEKYCFKCKEKYGCQIMGLVQFCDDCKDKLCEKVETEKTFPFICLKCFREKYQFTIKFMRFTNDKTLYNLQNYNRLLRPRQQTYLRE